jgi:hypothetical protein
MTERLEMAIAEVEKLVAEEQDAIAAWILEELESERQWDARLAGSQDMLARLAQEALSEHRAGRTETLSLDEL